MYPQERIHASLHQEGNLAVVCGARASAGPGGEDTQLQKLSSQTLSHQLTHLLLPTTVVNPGPTSSLPTENDAAVIRALSTHTVTNLDEEQEMCRNLDMLDTSVAQMTKICALRNRPSVFQFYKPLEQMFLFSGSVWFQISDFGLNDCILCIFKLYRSTLCVLVIIFNRIHVRLSLPFDIISV